MILYVRARKKGEVTLMVLADISKAFDTVKCKTLITKLSTLGFLHWLNSYLSNRTHFVQIDDRVSSKEHVRFVIPQGSILGPILQYCSTYTCQTCKIIYLTRSPHSSMLMHDTSMCTSCRPTDLKKSVVVKYIEHT